MAPADPPSQRPKKRLSRRTLVNEHVVVDDFPTDPPVSDRELAVIEAHLHDVLEIIEKIFSNYDNNKEKELSHIERLNTLAMMRFVLNTYANKYNK